MDVVEWRINRETRQAGHPGRQSRPAAGNNDQRDDGHAARDPRPRTAAEQGLQCRIGPGDTRRQLALHSLGCHTGQA
jgi:hypothetical protein